jgi:hypothetical protein
MVMILIIEFIMIVIIIIIIIIRKLSLSSNPEDHGFVITDVHLLSDVNVVITNHVGMIINTDYYCL